MSGTGRRCRGHCWLGVLLALVASRALAAEPAWEALVAAANQEGEVDVHGGPGQSQREALTEGFRRAYPAIKVNFTGSPGRDAIPMITRERQAGVYHWDVYVGGTPSILQTLKPAGAFAPLRPALMLPEVLDDAAWFGGLDSGWMDKEKTYSMGFGLTMNPTVVVNWDVVSHDDLKTYADLLKPQFAGKIVWDDPRLPGQGSIAAQELLLNFGPEYLATLMAKQKIVYISNTRQNVEGVVRGQYPIGIATAMDQLEPFRAQGLGKNISGFRGDAKILTGGPGYGTVSLMDRAPHPSAAKLYVNWLLSREAQAEWSTKTNHNSRRIDVKQVAPALFPPAGAAVIDTQSEAQIAMHVEAGRIATQSIPARANP
jgi:iron(III) transport system substrate-binding protein